jgi:hypothetical protein
MKLYTANVCSIRLLLAAAFFGETSLGNTVETAVATLRSTVGMLWGRCEKEFYKFDYGR